MGGNKEQASEVAAGLRELADLIEVEQDIRLVVLVSAAYLESLSKYAIINRLPAMRSKLRTRMFEGPLQSANARFDLLEALGLCTQEVAESLRCFARIRNRFAHHFALKDCEEPELKTLIAKLRTQMKGITEREEYRNFNTDSDEEFVRSAATVLCLTLVARLLRELPN